MDPADRTAEIEAHQRAAAGVDRARVVKRDPHLPLTCLDCGKDIGAGRLAVVPDARRCTLCQAEHEDRERRSA